jgi:hypothetical protein
MNLRKIFILALFAPLGLELPAAAQQNPEAARDRTAIQEMMRNRPTNPEPIKAQIELLKKTIAGMRERRAPDAAIERLEGRIKFLEESLQNASGAQKEVEGEPKKERPRRAAQPQKVEAAPPKKVPALNDDALPPEFGAKLLKLEYLQNKIGHLRAAAQQLKAAEAHDLAQDIMAKAESLENESIVAKQMLDQDVNRFKRERSAEAEMRERIEQEIAAQTARARQRDEQLQRERQKIEQEMESMRKREQEQARLMERQQQELEAVRRELKMREEAMRKEVENNEREMRERAERQIQEVREKAEKALREAEQRVRVLEQEVKELREKAAAPAEPKKNKRNKETPNRNKNGTESKT